MTPEEEHACRQALIWRKEAEDLREALEDALDGMQDMFSDVPDYFAKKWDHQGFIDRTTAALTAERSTSQQKEP